MLMFQFHETSLGITIQKLLKITPTQNPDASVKQRPARHSSSFQHNFRAQEILSGDTIDLSDQAQRRNLAYQC